MPPRAYYNENDPYCVEWLRNLISQNLIAPGDVDSRDIRDVKPYEIAPYTQFHFFAGLGGWSRALRLADFPDHRKVWTGSCPCQPFSAAGRAGGFADERHLWPHWFQLIGIQRPAIIFGEQVASKPGLAWFDLVQADLEGANYAVGSADLCAASVGAPHIRQRLWFVAQTSLAKAKNGYNEAGKFVWASSASEETAGRLGVISNAERERVRGEGCATTSGTSSRMQEADEQRQRFRPDVGTTRSSLANPDFFVGNKRRESHATQEQGRRHADRSSQQSDLADADSARSQVGRESQLLAQRAPIVGDGWWELEPDVGRVAHGIPARVAKLRALGNAIVPQVAAEFIKAACPPEDS